MLVKDLFETIVVVYFRPLIFERRLLSLHHTVRFLQFVPV